MVKYIAIGPGFVGYFGLIGALKKLADNGRLSDLSELSGASAGAIAGFMYIATKGNFDRMLKTSLKVPLKTLMKPNLRTFLTHYGIVSYEKVFNVLSDTLSHLIPGKTDISFKELYDHYPIKLHVAGFCLDLQKTMYFSVDTDPDMSVLEALHISSCVPILFPAHEFKGWKYIDGATAETTPCGPFVGKLDALGIIINHREKMAKITDLKSYIQMILKSVACNRFSYLQFVPHTALNLDGFDLFNFSANHEEKLRMFAQGYETAAS